MARLSPLPLQIANPGNLSEALFYGITKSGEMLFRVPSQMPDDGSLIQPLGRKKIETGETPQQAAMQGLVSMTGRQPLHIIDFGYAHQKDGTTKDYVAFQKFSTDLIGIAHGLELGPKSLGIIAIKPEKLAQLVDGGEPVWMNFLPAKTGFIQQVVRLATKEAKAVYEPLTITHLISAAAATPAPAQPAKGPVSLAHPVEIMVEAKDFLGKHDHLAIGLQILMTALETRAFPHVTAGKAHIQRTQALAQLLPRAETQFSKPVPGASLLR